MITVYTMISRKSRRLRKDNKPVRQRLESNSLSRLASTPIGNTKPVSVESTPSQNINCGTLPELNLSRVENQNLNCHSPSSPFIPADFQSKTRQLKESFRRESREGNGALTDALLSTSINLTTYDNFVGYRDRMQKVIDRKRRFSSMFPVRVSLSERFREIGSETKTCKQLKLDKGADDTNSCNSVSSPDFNACPTPPPYRALNACVTPPTPRCQVSGFETPPPMRNLNSHVVTRSQTNCFRSVKSCYQLPNNPAVGTSSPSSQRVPIAERTKSWLSPRVRRSPRVPEHLFKSPVVAPNTPNSKSMNISKHYEIEFQVPLQDLSDLQSDRTSPRDKSMSSPRDTREVSLLSPPPRSFTSDLEVTTGSDSSSKSVSQCMSQLSVSCPSDLQPASDSSLKVTKKSMSSRRAKGRRSVNMHALEWPFTTLEDSELRYIQACSSTILAATAAHEDSVFDSRRKSGNDSSLEKKGLPLQPSGDNCSGVKNDFLKELRKQNVCNFPTYRFCFEFVKPKRLEDSRFGLIFAARNRIDGRIYCIKKSRGNGDQLTDRQGNLIDERSGPSYAEARKELQQEAIALANIPFHQNIIRYFSTWIEYDCLYVQLEYCNGGSLLDYLENYRDSLPKFRLLQMMGDIGSAVQHLHEHAMVHLDLTPGNILIDLPSLYRFDIEEDIQEQLDNRKACIDQLMRDQNEKLVFKLADFGRCRTQSQASILEEVGDPEFMPFEVFGSIDGRLSDDIDIFKIDVFSFGLTIYRAMGGKYIQKPETDEEKINFHKRLTYPPNSDKYLFKFVQKMVRMQSFRPSMDEVLDYPGVCEASWSQHCVAKQMKLLQKAYLSNRNLRPHK